MKKSYGILLMLIAGTMMLESCKKEVFDQDIYNKIISMAFPIDPIDSTQTWNLFTLRSITIRVNGNVENMDKVQVLNYNPDDDSKAEIMAEFAAPEEGNSYTMLFAAPETQTIFYAAIKTTDKKYFIVPFTTADTQVSFNSMESVSYTGDLAYQAFTYCFEEDFPEPGDYDFNDCVMRISLQPGDKTNQMKMNVTLTATGAAWPIAGAVRIKNFNHNQIESVEIADGKAFDDGYPLTLRAIPDGSTLQSGQNGEPVIRLFEDAMWCLAHNDPDDAGKLTRYKINVSREENDTFKKYNSITKTFIITFKESVAGMIQNFTLGNLDPFIITAYNGNYWETHVYEDRLAKVLYDYYFQASIHITWGLCIPTGTFKWPLEGLLIGTYKNGVLTGAYREFNHSFGQWAAQKDQSKDWFLYPTNTEVY